MTFGDCLGLVAGRCPEGISMKWLLFCPAPKRLARVPARLVFQRANGSRGTREQLRVKDLENLFSVYSVCSC